MMGYLGVILPGKKLLDHVAMHVGPFTLLRQARVRIGRLGAAASD
jgi:hypothetical protein